MTTNRATRSVRRGLVVAQVALSLTLVVGAALLLRSFVALLGEDRGFRTHDVNVMVVQSWDHIPADARASFVRTATEQMGAIPGVRGAAVANSIPLAEGIGAERATYTIPGRPLPRGAEPSALYTIVSADYFRTLGISITGGRAFTDADGAGGRAVAIVNEALARRLWPNEDPVGRSIDLTFADSPVRREIVGVAGNVRRFTLSDAAPPTVYVPFAQRPTGANAFFVWTERDDAALRRRLKETLWQFSAGMPVSSETTMAHVVGESVRDRRFLLTIVGMSAVLAYLLAVVGIFGVMSYTTSQRTREIGIRIAFGARRRDVVRMVLWEGSRLAIGGTLLGLAGAAVLGRSLQGMLYTIADLDPLAFIGGAALLLASALLASWIPAVRAARQDAVGALRSE